MSEYIKVAKVFSTLGGFVAASTTIAVIKVVSELDVGLYQLILSVGMLVGIINMLLGKLDIRVLNYLNILLTLVSAIIFLMFNNVLVLITTIELLGGVHLMVLMQMVSQHRERLKSTINLRELATASLFYHTFGGVSALLIVEWLNNTFAAITILIVGYCVATIIYILYTVILSRIKTPEE